MRVGVFIDGQNVTIGARHAFGHGEMHPLLLARELTRGATAAAPGSDVELVEVRYATGVPDPEFDPDGYATQSRRHELMVATDVVVLERRLRYRWEWVIRDRDLGSAYKSQGEVTKARVKSYNRGQEKGIDVWLALDALVMCTRSDLDLVILASADSDLDLVPDYLRMVPGNAMTRVVQARVLADHKDLRQNVAYDETIRIGSKLFDRCRDDFDYTAPLRESDVATFCGSIGVRSDGLRD